MESLRDVASNALRNRTSNKYPHTKRVGNVRTSESHLNGVFQQFQYPIFVIWIFGDTVPPNFWSYLSGLRLPGGTEDRPATGTILGRRDNVPNLGHGQLDFSFLDTLPFVTLWRRGCFAFET